MARKRFADMNCSVAQSLDIIGDWWTLLIVREALLGTQQFADFQSRLGIAKNILSKRLQRLVENEILMRVDIGRSGSRFAYRLTPRGKDLLTVITALREWGDRWIFGEGNEPVVIRDRRTGGLVPPLRITDGEGLAIEARHLRAEPGPGATREILERTRTLD